MFSIGEFSKRSGLSIKTLRLYDRQGLLTPAAVDEDTGYRYYRPTQILLAEKIQFYRHCDLSLKTIAEILRLEAIGDEASLLSLLEAHQPVLRERLNSMHSLQRRIRSLRLEHESVSAAGKNGGDGVIEVVATSNRTVVASKKFGDHRDVFPLIEELTDFALSQKLKIDGPPMLLWGGALSVSSSGKAAEVEVAVPVIGRFQSTTLLFRRRLPGGNVARLVFRGSRSKSGLHYERLFSWVIENNWQIDGPFREIYLNAPGTVKESEYLTELQVPIVLPGKQRERRAAPR